MLLLIAKPSLPVVSSSPERATSGQTVTFTCESHGFSPRNVNLTWFKNGNVLPAVQTTVVPSNDSVSYNISSRTVVELSSGDVRSQVICEVAHDTLQSPLRGTANLSEFIRGRGSRTQPWLHPNMAAPQVTLQCLIFLESYSHLSLPGPCTSEGWVLSPALSLMVTSVAAAG